MELVRVLRESSNEDLGLLVSYLTKPVTGRLSKEAKYQRYYPDHAKYVDEIAHEIRLFGGNTFANKYRGGGPPIILPILAPILPFLPGEGPPYKEMCKT